MNSRLRRFLPLTLGAVVVLVLGLVAWFPGVFPGSMFRRLEWMTYDWRVRIASKADAPRSDRLGLVVIDQTALDKLNETRGDVWPLPRDVYAHMVRELYTQGATAVGMDIIFLSEQPKAEPVPVPVEAGGTIAPDDLLASYLKRAGNVVLGTSPRPGGRGELALPLPKFRASSTLGHVIGNVDDDGVLRRVKPYVDDPEAGRVWQLGLAVAARGLGIDLSKAGVEPHRITLTMADGQTRLLPLDDDGMLMIDWSIPYGSPAMKAVNLGHVIASAVKRQRGAEVVNPLKNTLVIVGSTGIGSNISDRGATPLGRSDFRTGAHWNIINSILTDRQVTIVRMAAQIALLALLAAIAWAAVSRFRPGWAALAVLAAGAGHVGVCVWMFVESRLWLPMVLPLTSLGATYVLLLIVSSAPDRRREIEAPR